MDTMKLHAAFQDRQMRRETVIVGIAGLSCCPYHSFGHGIYKEEEEEEKES